MTWGTTMLRGIAFAILTLAVAITNSVTANAETRVCNTGNVTVDLAYALDGNFTHVIGWIPLKPGKCEERSLAYWLAIRQLDQQGRPGIADYKPEFGQRPIFYDNMSKLFCVNPIEGFNYSLASGNTCATGQERVRFGVYARQRDSGLLPPTWNIATKPDVAISLFGSGDGKPLDASKQLPQLDAGDQLLLGVVAGAAAAILKNTLPNIDLDKYKKPPSGIPPWSQIENDYRKEAKNEQCLSIVKSYYHCLHSFQLTDDRFQNVPCATRKNHYDLCQAGKSDQLKAELDIYLKREKEPLNVIPIVRQDKNAVHWEYGTVPPTFHPSLADAEAVAGGRAIKISMWKDAANDGDAHLTGITLSKFRYYEWSAGLLRRDMKKLFYEDQSKIEGSLILQCLYYRHKAGTGYIGFPKFYWYRQVPPAAEPTRLKGRITNHPLLDFEEAREACPSKPEGTVASRQMRFNDSR